MTHSAYARIFLFSPFFVAAFLALPHLAAASANLIQNPTFVTPSASASPMNWIPVAWGAAASSTFSYPVAGEDDAFAAQITVPTYSAAGEGNGSAEWLPGPVPVTPSALYTFSDWYKSDADSYVSVQWLLADGTFLTESVATLAPTGGQWANDTQIFSAPANAVSVTPLHFIQSAGTLTIDNVSLTEGASSFPGALNKAIVSLTFDNGYESQYMNALPILQAAHLPSTFYIITNQITNAIYDFFTDPNETITTVTGSTSVAWSPIYTDSKVQSLIFSDTYTAAGTSTIEADYTINSVASSTVLGTLAAGTNAHAQFTFSLPLVASSTVTPIRILHSSAGALTASNPSLIENIPQRMSVAQLLALQAAGYEIGSHTVTHSDLTALSTVQVSQELQNSRAALASWGITPADGFAYPFGNRNAGIETQTAGAGYIDARTVDIGYNTALTDSFALKSQSLTSSTPFSVVQSWIDTAIANKLWLILTFHDVDNLATINANGETYGTTPQTLQQITDYLNSQSSNVSVLTVHDALGKLATTTAAPPAPPIVTPPVSAPVSSGGGGGSIGSGSGHRNPVPGEIQDAGTATDTALVAPSTTDVSSAPAVTDTGEPAAGSVLGAATFKFNRNLTLRSRGADVSELQRFLIAHGFRIPSGASGYFGAQTKAAVIAYQKANKLPRTGYVGPRTLALLNKGSGLALGN